MSPPTPDDFTSIPILDLSLASSPDTRPQLLSLLHHAITQIGFLYIKNHDVPSAIIDDLVNALPILFSLSAADKNAVALHNSPHFLGYSGLGSEKTAKAVDQREQFEFATELEDGSRKGDEAYRRLYGPNQWPSAYPAIRPIVESYISALTHLSTTFLSIVADALSVPPESLTKFLSDQHRIKLVKYPAPTPGIPSTQGVGPHKDSSGWWTFLLQASPPPIGGLQVLNRSGAWIDVPSIPGTFVVNIGQTFEVVSGGLCRATVHRVLSGQWERYSVPFFQGVRGDVGKVEVSELWGALRRENGDEKNADLDADGRRRVAEGIDSAYLKGPYDTWGEWQLRTKIRSHPDVGEAFYKDVWKKYLEDD